MLLPLSRSIIAVNVALIILASTAVVARLFARRKQHQPLKADDITIIVALTISYGLFIDGIYVGATNLDAIPVPKLSLSKWHEHEKLIWVDILMCHIVYGVIKFSILLFYRRIFITPRFRLTTSIFMGVVAVWMITATIGHIFSASPVDEWWTSKPGFDLAFDYEVFLTAMAGIDIALDVFTLLLPLPVIKSLHVNGKKKLSLIGIFSLGFFCVVSSAVRLYYVWQLHLVVAGSLPRSKFTAISTWNDVWAHIEAYASIVTACLPMLVPLFSGIRSPESLLGSFKAFFSLKSSSDAHSSKHSHALREVGNVPSPSSTVRNWYELPGTKSTASRAVRLPDEESLVAHPSSIQVKTSIRSQYEPRDK